MKKKRVVKICGIVLLALILVQNIMFRLVLNGYAVNDVYDDDLSGRLTAEEIDTLDEVFKSGEISLSGSHCLDSEFFVVINGDVYMPDLCGYDVVYCPTKFITINLTNNQKNTVKEILLNHISKLPTP